VAQTSVDGAIFTDLAWPVARSAGVL